MNQLLARPAHKKILLPVFLGLTSFPPFFSACCCGGCCCYWQRREGRGFCWIHPAPPSPHAAAWKATKSSSCLFVYSGSVRCCTGDHLLDRIWIQCEEIHGRRGCTWEGELLLGVDLENLVPFATCQIVLGTLNLVLCTCQLVLGTCTLYLLGGFTFA